MRITTLDGVGGAARPRLDPLDHGPTINARLTDDQIIDVTRAPVLGVAQRALEYLLQKAGTLIGQEAQRFQGFVSPAAANQGGERPNLSRRHVGKSMSCYVVHGRILFALTPALRKLSLPRFFNSGGRI